MIELIQIVGKRAGKGGTIETIAQPVDFIKRDGRVVGTIARFSGAAICFNTPHLNDAEKEDIRREVERIRNENGEFIGVAEKTSAPPVLPPELTDEPEQEQEESSIILPDDYEDDDE